MGDVLQPGVIIKPQMDKELAQSLARSLFLKCLFYSLGRKKAIYYFNLSF